MRWLSKDVEAVPGKKDKILSPCTFITGTDAAYRVELGLIWVRSNVV
jgi:hypothetical protein